jgi:nicotinamide-nucleotide amidase
MTFPLQSLALAKKLLAACAARRWHLATAESCTGGLIIGCLTEIAGSSAVVARGYVTYDNLAKQEMLGVSPDLLASVGAVSEEVARAMAAGARERARVDLAIAVTGIAGPGGATPTKPVGLVHIAVALRDQPALHTMEIFPGDRAAVRLATVDAALELALRATRSHAP